MSQLICNSEMLNYRVEVLGGWLDEGESGCGEE